LPTWQKESGLPSHGWPHEPNFHGPGCLPAFMDVTVKVARSGLRIPLAPWERAEVRGTVMAAAPYILSGGADAMAVSVASQPRGSRRAASGAGGRPLGARKGAVESTWGYSRRVPSAHTPPWPHS